MIYSPFIYVFNLPLSEPQMTSFPIIGQLHFNQLIWMSYIRILGIRYSGVCFQSL